jgi:predicted MFS family arabinose efflux permease
VVQTAAIFLFAFAAAHATSERGLAAICFVEAFSSSLATAVLFTAMMDWCRPIVGATDYTVQASAVVIATGLATLASGRMAEALGYTKHFIAAGAIGAIATLIAIAIYPPPRSR